MSDFKRRSYQIQTLIPTKWDLCKFSLYCKFIWTQVFIADFQPAFLFSVDSEIPSPLFWNSHQYSRCREAEPEVRAVRLKCKGQPESLISSGVFFQVEICPKSQSRCPYLMALFSIDMIGKQISIEKIISQTHRWPIYGDKEPSVQSKSHVRRNWKERQPDEWSIRVCASARQMLLVSPGNGSS